MLFPDFACLRKRTVLSIPFFGAALISAKLLLARPHLRTSELFPAAGCFSSYFCLCAQAD